jgi:long-chain fatty acid transport protein
MAPPLDFDVSFRSADTRRRSRVAHLQAIVAFVAVVALPSVAWSAGFEIPENSTLSVARGGTGVVMKRDPSALYFNPALLPRTQGVEVLGDSNLVALDLDFQRDDLVYFQNDRRRSKSFAPVSNEAGPYPVPALALSWDFGLEDFAAGLGIFAPPAYGRRCYGRMQNGDCKVDRDGGARHMLIESSLLQAYGTLGAGYRFDFERGQLSVGASAMLAYQRNRFKLAINAEVPSPTRPWQENPDEEAIFEARELSSFNATGVLGVAYELDGFRLAASYRPPIAWESEGTATIDFPDDLEELQLGLSDDRVTLKTRQAGSLRFGWGYEHGQHPGRPDRPLFDVEVNGIWENWSAVERFEIVPAGDITSEALGDEGIQDLRPIQQRKNYRDTFSLRLGGSWGALRWLTLHGGALLETAAQPEAYTNVDFVSWERYGASLGTSFHVSDWLDLKLAYMFMGSPSRDVENGEVYNPIPLSQCRGPDYQNDACQTPGTPPGNPQNEGQWSARFHVASAGVSMTFD